MPPTIREARADELDAVSELLGRAYAQYIPPPDAPLTADDRLAWENYRQDISDVRSRLADGELIVAEENGRVLGAVTFFPPARSAQYPGHSSGNDWPTEYASFRLLGVDPDARGRSIGRLLTEACIERARELGASVLALHTTELMDVARELYKRMGWVRAPDYDFYPMPDFCVEAYTLDL
jgi:GNAT superfamily N-acetyltransferase